ncbi:MAG: 4-alpha-glucanotransferase, partial [Acetobacteraceae bacterium]|nr:4-alpha-glucanotransferase [Acetobacteraceae bacterium]
MSDDALRELARRAGIAVEWQDYAEREHVVIPDILRRILLALGLPADTRGDLAASRRLLTRRTGIADLPPLITGTAGRPTRLDLGATEPKTARLRLERGDTRDVSLVPARGRLRVPPISEPGYHRLDIDDRQIVVAIAPAQSRAIEDVVPDARLWGIAAQVYSVRSAGDGGIGNVSGVAQLAEAAASLGADAIALSPLHALFTADPHRFGPYSPSSRLFLNPLHAAPEIVFGAEHVAEIRSQAGLDADFARYEKLELIDWPGAAASKLALTRALFDAFMDGAQGDGSIAR